jgi:hypothetical protein
MFAPDSFQAVVAFWYSRYMEAGDQYSMLGLRRSKAEEIEKVNFSSRTSDLFARNEIQAGKRIDSRILHDPLEVDDDIVQLGIQHLLHRIKRSREVDHRVVGTCLKRP